LFRNSWEKFSDEFWGHVDQMGMPGEEVKVFWASLSSVFLEIPFVGVLFDLGHRGRNKWVTECHGFAPDLIVRLFKGTAPQKGSTARVI
jgi:hypothetical protein